ncbi:MAG: hypothetical protein IPJ65_39795 [Archangiaceae bacterium]|nr:hypothetical protein [Archangiaceae bacterium]
MVRLGTSSAHSNDRNSDSHRIEGRRACDGDQGNGLLEVAKDVLPVLAAVR